MKKKLSLLLFSSLLMLPSAAFASESTVNDEIIEGVNVKGFAAESLSSVSALAAADTPHYFGETKVYAIGGASAFSDAYTNSSKEKQLRIDRIYAKAKLYVSGDLYSSDVDDQKDASHAGIYTAYGVRNIGNQESIGEHKFENAGYKIVIFETEDT